MNNFEKITDSINELGLVTDIVTNKTIADIILINDEENCTKVKTLTKDYVRPIQLYYLYKGISIYVDISLNYYDACVIRYDDGVKMDIQKVPLDYSQLK